MTALKNILADFLFQFRIKGALGARLSCVASYYKAYVGGRLAGLSQGDSRLRALRALAARGGNSRVVAVDWPPGMRMECDVFSAAFMVKEFASDAMYDVFPGFRPEPGQTVVDIGGHQGFFTVLAASRVGRSGRVVAVEAFPDNFRLLKRNVESNALTQVSLVPAAAADVSGEASFHVFKEVTGGSLVLNPEGAETVTVNRERLDDILSRLGVSRVDLIKIDVEGACLSVLVGAPRTLEAMPRLVMEVEGDEAEVDKVRSHVEGLGYTVRRGGSILYARDASKA